MKKVLTLIIGTILFSGALYAGDLIVSFNSVAVTTHTPVLVMGYNPSRKMSSCYNSDATYTIHISTWLSADLTELLAQGTYNPLTAGSSTRDDFFVYKSSWYATASSESITGLLYYMEKE